MLIMLLLFEYYSTPHLIDNYGKCYLTLTELISLLYCNIENYKAKQ